MKTLYSPVVIATVLFACCSCDDFILDSESDTEFEIFLNLTMASYGEWIKNNDQDPSAPIANTILLSQGPGILKLTCKISNQKLANHSKTVNDLVVSKSDFTEYYFAVSREIHTPYQFQGDLNCSGVVRSIGFEDVEQDIHFNVTGDWTITVITSREVLEVFNVGIMNDKFDLTHSWTEYKFLPPAFSEIQLVNGTWVDNTPNGSMIANHTDVVLNVFASLYYDYLRQNSYQQSYDFNPSKRLLLRYLIDDIIKKSLISEIIPVNPPPSYSPTPRPGMPTTTPAPSTSNEPSTEESTEEDGNSTTPSSSSGTNVIVKPVFWALVIVYNLHAY